MKSPGKHPTRSSDTESPRVPVDQDSDWVYTGVVYACPDCGFEFAEYPPDLDTCPECGADIWQSEH